MIESVQGNLLEANAEALVNAVNSVGVMGKGLALQFKKAFPANFTAYKKACDAGDVGPGRMHVFATEQLQNPKFIIIFPTKRHWKQQSRLEDIEAGLLALVSEIQNRDILSVAVPPLGCGYGGLNWSDVLPRIQSTFTALPDVRVLLFEPTVRFN